MKRTLKAIVLIGFILISTVVRADSPLTSTRFSEAYREHKKVVYANMYGWDTKTLKFLGKKKENSVLKMTVINSLGWGNEGSTKKFETYLLSKRKGLKPEVFTYLRSFSEEEPKETEQTLLLTADDLMCWAYAQALEDYFNPRFAARAAFFAFSRDGENMARATVFTLIACQMAFDVNWCEVYQLGKDFIETPTYEKANLSLEAVRIIMDYLVLYQAEC